MMRKKTFILLTLAVFLIVAIPFAFFSDYRIQAEVRPVQLQSEADDSYNNLSLPSKYSTEIPVQEPGVGLFALDLPGASISMLKDIHLTIPRDVQVERIPGDKFVLGGTFTLGDGEVLDGSLVVFGGLVSLEAGSIVAGDVILLGGNAIIDGSVEGDILLVGGLLELGQDAIVEGDVAVIAGHMERNPDAMVYGKVTEGVEGPVSIDTPGSIDFPFSFPGGGDFPSIQITQNPALEFLWVLFRSIMWAAVAVLTVLFVPRHTEQVGKVAISQPLVSGGMGLLSMVVAPIALLIMIITIIGIPVALLSIFLVFVVWIFGVISLGTQVGKRLGKTFNRDWALAVSAGLGTFLLTLVIESINKVIPCLGWLGLLLAAMLGIGAVVLTRFGTRDYPVVELQQQFPPAGPPDNGGDEVLPDDFTIDLAGQTEIPSDTGRVNGQDGISGPGE